MVRRPEFAYPEYPANGRGETESDVQMKITTFLYLVLLAVLVFAAAVSARFGWRCHQLKKAMPTSVARYRAAMVPVALDLTAVRVAGDQTCDIGYAEFVVPENTPLQMVSIFAGRGIKATAGSVSFAFLLPWMVPGIDLPAIACLFPDTARKRSENMPTLGPVPNQLDLLFQMEQTLPLTWEKVMTMRTPQFTLHLANLAMKANHKIGLGGVYTFATPEIRGYIQVGEAPSDHHSAHVALQDSGSMLSVGGKFWYPPGTNDDILAFLKPVLKSFRFKVHTITSDDQIRKLIADAGIKPDKSDVPEPHNFDKRAYYRAHH